MGNYSNGWGHLIVTITVLIMSTFLIYTGKLDTSAVMGLLGSVVSFWFMSGSVNRFAVSARSETPPPSPPAVTINQNTSPLSQPTQGVNQ